MNETSKTNLTLSMLIVEVRGHLKELNYAKETIRRFDNHMSAFENYAKEEGVEKFSITFGHRFLLEKYQIEPFGTNYSKYKKSIRRLITMLSDYQNHGIIFKRQSIKPHIWAEEYYPLCENFMKDEVVEKLQKSTQRTYRSSLERFISYLIKNKVSNISELTAKVIEDYYSTYIGYKKSTIAYSCYVLKGFLTYAFNNGYIEKDLSVFLPFVKVNARANLPSTFTKDEIDKLILAVDRSNPLGKRDYAILLLAIRYGMRVSEIRDLKLNNLNFVTNKISYIQNKTGVTIDFDILENVGWALIDYLKNGRPVTNSENVFIRHVAPYDAFGNDNNLAHVLQKYLSRAGIERTNKKHYGMHTIRHSLASHMLEQGTPLHVVSKTLGHLELNSTMVYTKVDLNMLSQCMLEVPDDTY